MGDSQGNSSERHSGRIITVPYLESPPQIARRDNIHRRRQVPMVREGTEWAFHSRDTRALIHTTERAPAEDIRIIRNTAIVEPGQMRTASNVGEPSVAMNDDLVFFTGNWYAAMSQDGGRTFRFVDPALMQRADDPAGVDFCCDQVVNYLPSIDTFVWLMQYGPRSGGNLQRLAFATTADVKAGRWRTWDITPQILGVPANAFLDFPDLAVSDSFLYATTNVFMPDDSAGTAVARIPIAGIRNADYTLQKFVSSEFFSFRVAQNCRDTAFFAAHRTTSALVVFVWPEGDDQPASREIAVARWIGSTRGYYSRTPDGRRWLDRADPRITGATLAKNELWFAWGVDAGSNRRPQPFVQMARINVSDMTLIENVNLFDADSAICYAGLATNANDEIGVSYAIGGAVFPSHVVGFLSGDRQNLIVGKGERGPLPSQNGGAGEWGDYLTVRPVYPGGRLFASAGYALVGLGDGGNQDATPRFVIFGRGEDASGGEGGPGQTGPGGDGGIPVPGGGDAGGGAIEAEGPITDVNRLRAVSASIAARIKRACGVNPGARAAERPAPVLEPELLVKPGKERWPVKTGQDADRNLVGKNIVAGRSLGAGFVDATVEELISIPRPADMPNVHSENPIYQSKRSRPVEATIWRIEVTITALKLEEDGDYHLVMQGGSGETMIGEVPLAQKEFIGDCPWRQNIADARRAIDDQFVRSLSPRDFVLPPGGGMLVPRDAVSPEVAPPAEAMFKMPESFATPEDVEAMQLPAFKTKVKPTAARITGIGFFDKVHGQMGVSQSNGIELHPILKIQWL